jgi:hypothetical protein
MELYIKLSAKDNSGREKQADGPEWQEAASRSQLLPR